MSYSHMRIRANHPFGGHGEIRSNSANPTNQTNRKILPIDGAQEAERTTLRVAAAGGSRSRAVESLLRQGRRAATHRRTSAKNSRSASSPKSSGWNGMASPWNFAFVPLSSLSPDQNGLSNGSGSPSALRRVRGTQIPLPAWKHRPIRSAGVPGRHAADRPRPQSAVPSFPCEHSATLACSSNGRERAR